MNIKLVLSTLPLILASGSVMAADFAEGYYGSARYLQIEQRAKEMDTSARPGVGQFVSGQEKEHFGGAAIAGGYQFGNGWRTEAEYTFKKKIGIHQRLQHLRHQLQPYESRRRAPDV